MVNVWLSILVVLAAIVFKIYRYICDHRNYWKQRNVPGPVPSFWWGNLIDLVKPNYPSPFQIRDWTAKYGKAYGMQEGWNNVLVISDLDAMQELFVRNFDQFYGRKNQTFVRDVDHQDEVHVFMARGQRWKRLRTLTSPTFSVNSLKKVKDTVEDSVRLMIDHMDEYADVQKSFNIHALFQELTMDVICRIAMGFEESHQFHNEFLEDVKKVFGERADRAFNVAILSAPDMIKEPIRAIAEWTAGMRGMAFVSLKDKIKQAVADRRKLRNGSDEHHEASDFIDLFLDVEAEVDLSSTGYSKANVKVEKKMTASEIVMQCFVFLLAGFDTTANSLAYASYHIAKSPEVRKRIQEEIDQVCVDEDVSYEQIQKLRYMDMVVKEALRLYPLAAFASSRICMEATKLGDIEIEKGTYVMADVFTTHYSKEIWGEDAHEFNPDRWDNIKRHPLSWLPFGAGPRMCIGKRLADMEEKLALVHILRKYDLVAAHDTEEKLTLLGSTTISPASVTVRLRNREY